MKLNRALYKAAITNGLFWTVVLLVLTYFKNGQINWVYVPLWFVFFAITGVVRKYYLDRKKNN